MSLPEAPKIPVEFLAAVKRGPREFNGSYLISQEMLDEAVQHDEFLCRIQEYMDQDRAYLEVIGGQLIELSKQSRAIRRRMMLIKNRIASRIRQKKHFTALLRKRLAWERNKELRKEIGLT